MKKALCILLSLIALLSLSCCNGDKATNGNATDGNLMSTDYVGTDIVSVTMHLSLLKPQYIEDPQLYCTENGFESCTVDEENSLFTVTMQKSVHKQFLYKIGNIIVNDIADFIEIEAFPYFKSFNEYNEDFSRITLFVDKEGYNEDIMHSMLLYYVSENCMFYQNYTERNEYSCKITVKDEATGEIIDARSYKQDNSLDHPVEEE